MWLMINERGIHALVSDEFAYDYGRDEPKFTRIEEPGHVEVWYLLTVFQAISTWIQEPLF